MNPSDRLHQRLKRLRDTFSRQLLTAQKHIMAEYFTAITEEIAFYELERLPHAVLEEEEEDVPEDDVDDAELTDFELTEAEAEAEIPVAPYFIDHEGDPELLKLLSDDEAEEEEEEEAAVEKAEEIATEEEATTEAKELEEGEIIDDSLTILAPSKQSNNTTRRSLDSGLIRYKTVRITSPLWCPVEGCKGEFIGRNEFIYHYETRHPQIRFICSQCPTQKLWGGLSVYRHQFYNHQEGHYTCAYHRCTFTDKLRCIVMHHFDHEHIDGHEGGGGQQGIKRKLDMVN